MRIYSKFKDYYDHVVQPSDTIVWRRQQQEYILDVHKKLAISLSTTEFLINAFNRAPTPPVFLDSKKIHCRIQDDMLILGFCGKLHLLYILYVIDPIKTERKVYNNLEAFVEAYNASSKHTTRLEGNKTWHNRLPFNQKGADAWQQEFDLTKRVEEIFVELKAPIFLVQRTYSKYGELVVNPQMSYYGMQRLVDPWAAYQEIEMYLSNKLATETMEMPNFSDELKRDAHGFDNWSFKQVGPKLRKSK